MRAGSLGVRDGLVFGPVPGRRTVGVSTKPEPVWAYEGLVRREKREMTSAGQIELLKICLIVPWWGGGRGIYIVGDAHCHDD